MEVTISKPDIDCLARGIVELAPQIRACLDTPEQQARYQTWLQVYEKRSPPPAQK